jgi:hypothetical protein
MVDPKKVLLLITVVACMYCDNISSQVVNNSRKSFSLFFPNRVDTLTPLLRNELRIVAREILASNQPTFSVLFHDKGSGALHPYSRGYNAYWFLIDSASVPQHRLRLMYDLKGKPNLVIIRASTKEENSGTNCGVKKHPNLK